MDLNMNFNSDVGKLAVACQCVVVNVREMCLTVKHLSSQQHKNYPQPNKSNAMPKKNVLSVFSSIHHLAVCTHSSGTSTWSFHDNFNYKVSND